MQWHPFISYPACDNLERSYLRKDEGCFFYAFSTGRSQSWFDYGSTPLIRYLSILPVRKTIVKYLRAEAPTLEAVFASAAIWKLGLFSVAANRTEQIIDLLAFFQSQKKRLLWFI